MKLRRLIQIALVSISVLSISGCIIHVGGGKNSGDKTRHSDSDLSSILGDIQVDAYSKVGDVSNVNGRITLKTAVEAKTVDTVNGGIIIKDQVSVDSASTVNGSIKAESNFRVRDSLSTVNGSIDVALEGTVGDDISTVNGDISLIGVAVGGDIETKTGDINLLAGTTVAGDIIFQETDKKGWSANKLPTLTIDENSFISGRIILHRKVILEIQNQDLLNKVEHDYPSAR